MLLENKKRMLVVLLMVSLAVGCFGFARYADGQSLPDTKDSKKEETVQTVAVEDEKQEKPEKKQVSADEKEETARNGGMESKAAENPDISKPAVSNTNTSAASKPENNGYGSESGTRPEQSSGNKGHYEERQVCIQEAYDEQVLVKKGARSEVLVQAAYDTEEMVYLDGAYYGPDTEERAWCYICEHFYDDHCEQQGHPFNNKTVNLTDPYWHNVEYRTVHHDAVYETRCEPDVYETVHHDAVYETQRVWIDD